MRTCGDFIYEILKSKIDSFTFFLGGKTCCAFDCTPNVDTA